MSRFLAPLFALFLAIFPTLAHAVTVDEILGKVDKNMTFDTREVTLSMTVTKGDRVKVYTMHSFGRGADESAVEYMAQIGRAHV